MAQIVGVIWGASEADYFCGDGWTKRERDLPGRQRKQ
jgi:hypothetical protein